MTDLPATLEHFAGDVAAALAYAEDHHPPTRVDLPNDIALILHRAGETWDVHDTGDPTRPRRSRGDVHVYDATAFAAAVTQRADPAAVVVYRDDATNRLTAVLNDDTADRPGFRDYRVALKLRTTPEWQAWSDGEGLGGQERFAQRIEDGEREIETPPAAEMLTLAQTFHAAKDVRFKSGTRLQDGQHQLQWEETINATAGEAGSAKIPETFTLALAPFVGAALFRVRARLRYRIVSRGDQAGTLSIGYNLIRPEDVMADAFTETADQVAAALPDTVFISGPVPDYVR